MKERIIEFLRAENKSSAQFAEEIGVQPSGISHIISGRNKPSLDFILKMLEKYHFISVEWLLFGKGSMYREAQMQSLFDQQFNLASSERFQEKNSDKSEKVTNVNTDKPAASLAPSLSESGLSGKNIVRIVWFYDDRTFTEYRAADLKY